MSLDPNARRRQEDLAKLKELETEFRNVVLLKSTVGNPVTQLDLEIRIDTAGSSRFPAEKQRVNVVQIDLPARYPFEPPKVTLKSPVWNPNIFPSGLICLGQKWVPTHNLKLLVQRVMQILALDPVIINTDSPANRDASEWYKKAKLQNSFQFPTVSLDRLRQSAQPKIVWRTIQ